MADVRLIPEGSREGFTVVSGTVDLPRAGVWHAVLKVDANALAVGTRAGLKVGAKDAMVGTVSRSELHGGMVVLWLVGGADGLRKSVEPVHYTSPPLKLVLTRLLGDVGESLAADSDADVMATQFQHWTTLRMTAGDALRCVLERAPEGVVWRMKADGSLWFGQETWPAAGVEASVVERWPEEGRVALAVAEPYLLPGTTVGADRIDAVQITIGAEVRVMAWLAS